MRSLTWYETPRVTCQLVYNVLSSLLLTEYFQVGRKRMYGLELILIIFATLAQALTSSSPSVDIVGVIIFWRVLMVRAAAATQDASFAAC